MLQVSDSDGTPMNNHAIKNPSNDMFGSYAKRPKTVTQASQENLKL